MSKYQRFIVRNVIRGNSEFEINHITCATNNCNYTENIKKESPKAFFIFSQVLNIYFLDLFSFNLMVSECLADLILLGADLKWMIIYSQCLILQTRNNSSGPCCTLAVFHWTMLWQRLEMVPKKETGEVNQNTQYLTQRMNTDQRRDVY